MPQGLKFTLYRSTDSKLCQEVEADFAHALARSAYPPSNLPAAVQSPHQCGIVGKLQVTAYWDTIGQPGRFDPKRFEQAGQIHSGGLALCVRIGGHDDLLHPPGGHPLQKLLDAQVIRSYASVSSKADPLAKKAVLTWKEIAREEVKSGEILLPYAINPSPEGGWHFLSIVLETGRHHQIRAQLSHAGMPIAADVRYGGAKVHGPRGAIALCAAQLSFRHPITGKYLTFSWNDDTNITAVTGR